MGTSTVIAPLYVMPRTPATWGGAAALWVTVAGWGAADRWRGDEPAVLTPHGVLTMEQALEATSLGGVTDTARRRRTPQWARQLVRDTQRSVTMTRYARGAVDLLASEARSVSGFVWQHHELFHSAGGRVADDAGVPLIEYVHAPIVWESRRWGVGRPGSGMLLERIAERPQLRRADLVACVSEEVRDELLRFGVEPSKLVVASMGVDQHRFSPDVDGSGWREKLADLGDFVLGWAGSVRRFHYVDLALHAVRDLRADGLSVGLAIAGDGQDRTRLETIASELGLDRWVRFVGQVPNPAMPQFLAAVDAAVITAGAGQEFHYSPLKLREYLAMGLPVVVPRLGEMSRLIDDGVHGLLYEPGDAKTCAQAVRRLINEPELSVGLRNSGRAKIIETETWEAISSDCLKRLGLGR